jgi:4a-hydroxytetrahydrobiopterin dehydratase
MADLSSKQCTPCRAGAVRLGAEELARLEREISQDWKIVEQHHLEKEYAFPDFRAALAFVQRVGDIAESEGHHPTLCLAWGRVRLTIWTRKVDGLTEADFILAAKVDRAIAPRR